MLGHAVWFTWITNLTYLIADFFKLQHLKFVGAQSKIKRIAALRGTFSALLTLFCCWHASESLFYFSTSLFENKLRKT